MNVFIGWSQAGGKEIALKLQTWLLDLFETKYTIHLSDDIESGDNWDAALSHMLNANFGILCFSPGFSPSWLCYEAGVLSETTRYDTSHYSDTENTKFRALDYRVAPVAFGIERHDIPDSLSKFEAKEFGYADMKNLINSINERAKKLAKGRDGTINQNLYMDSAVMLRKFQTDSEGDSCSCGSYAWLEREIADVMRSAFGAYLVSDFARDIKTLQDSKGGHFEIGNLCLEARHLLENLSRAGFSRDKAQEAVTQYRENIKLLINTRFQDDLKGLYENLGHFYFGSRFLFP